MKLILDGNSEHVAHVWKKLGIFFGGGVRFVTALNLDKRLKIIKYPSNTYHLIWVPLRNMIEWKTLKSTYKKKIPAEIQEQNDKWTRGRLQIEILSRMVLIIDGNSEYVVREWRQLCLFGEKIIRLKTVLDIIKWLTQIKQQKLLFTCASISELPSNIA